jgi:hypothetical protein
MPQRRLACGWLRCPPPVGALDLFQGNPFGVIGAVLASIGSLFVDTEPTDLLILLSTFTAILLGWLGREYALRTEDEPAPAS